MLRKGLALAALGLALLGAPALAATAPTEPKDVPFSFEGPFGQFDKGQLQRGYKVYRQVCAACHGLNLLAFRNLGQPGGPFFDPKHRNPNENPVVKALAQEIQVNDIDSETGDVIQRPATTADRFPSPFANEVAARAANGGALPPDLSVIAKARHGGADYLYSFLIGFQAEPPAGLDVPAGKYYNPYFPGDLSAFWQGPHDKTPKGGFVAMPPIMAPDAVTFDDGKPATVDQQAKDVAAFLAWASEPKMEERKKFGFGTMIYLLIFTGLLYASYRRLWRNVAH